jgi:adenylosuccinate synthase
VSSAQRPAPRLGLTLAALKYAVRIGGITHLVITKLDILSVFDTIKVCTDIPLRAARSRQRDAHQPRLERSRSELCRTAWLNEPIDEVRDVSTFVSSRAAYRSIERGRQRVIAIRRPKRNQIAIA